jgi:hypothetical protein
LIVTNPDGVQPETDTTNNVLAVPIQVWQPAVIGNGTVELGVNPQGDLGAPGTPSSGTGTTNVGVRYVPTNGEGLTTGTEGWGVADAKTGVSGWVANGNTSSNIQVVNFTSTPTTAVSVVNVGSTLQVTQNFHPSASPDLYEVTVTVQNFTSQAVDLRYRQVVGWSTEPTPGFDFVTFHGAANPAVLYDSDNSLASANPLNASDRFALVSGASGNFSNKGPANQGVLLDLKLGTLAANSSTTFTLWFGAAPDQATALAALSTVNAQVWGLGIPDTPAPTTYGAPNTFIVGFSRI